MKIRRGLIHSDVCRVGRLHRGSVVAMDGTTVDEVTSSQGHDETTVDGTWRPQSETAQWV